MATVARVTDARRLAVERRRRVASARRRRVAARRRVDARRARVPHAHGHLLGRRLLSTAGAPRRQGRRADRRDGHNEAAVRRAIGHVRQRRRAAAAAGISAAVLAHRRRRHERAEVALTAGSPRLVRVAVAARAARVRNHLVTRRVAQLIDHAVLRELPLQSRPTAAALSI